VTQGLDFSNCFFYDKQNPVSFTTSGGVGVYSSTSHRKLRMYYGYVFMRRMILPRSYGAC
jgi:hypothetical protein